MLERMEEWGKERQRVPCRFGVFANKIRCEGVIASATKLMLLSFYVAISLPGVSAHTAIACILFAISCMCYTAFYTFAHRIGILSLSLFLLLNSLNNDFDTMISHRMEYSFGLFG